MNVFALLIAVVGALLYAFGNAKASELGRITFFVGMLWFVQSAGHSIAFLR